MCSLEWPRKVRKRKRKKSEYLTNIEMLRRGFSTAAGMLPSTNVSARVLSVLKNIRCVPPSVTANTKFSDLGFDSLIKKDLCNLLENEFCVEVPAKDAANFHSAQDVTKYFSNHPKAR